LCSAGYGKTIAVSHWLENNTHTYAFLSVDEYDNNLNSFCERFCSALCHCQPENSALSEIIFHPSFQGRPDEFSLRAISALSVKKQAILVIDDLHLIHSNVVLQTLLVFINRLPANFQIVLNSRHELPLIFSDLWLKGKISRISADQLLFTNDEIKVLYKMRGKKISTEAADGIIQRTQGWAIGINALLLSDESDDQISERIYDYLDNFIHANIWQRWDEETRDFMICTAGLRILDPALCDELTNRNDSRLLLEELVNKGAFVTKRDNGMYHYHQLFQNFLKLLVKERGQKFENELLEKEGHWHLSQNDFQSAINCFIRTKNHDAIVKSLESVDYSYRPSLLAHKIVSVVKNPEVEIAIKKHPHLMILLIWGSFIDGDRESMISFMDEYYSKFPSIIARYPSLAHEIFYIKILDFRVSSSSIMNERDVLPKIVTNTLNKFLSMALPSSTVRKWILPMDTPTIHRGLRDFADIIPGEADATLEALLSKFGWVLGEELMMIGELGKTVLHYERGRLEEANIHAVRAVSEIQSHFSIELVFCVLATFVSVADALGQQDSQEIDSTLERISQLIESNKAYHLSLNFEAFKVRREIERGNTQAAEEWLAKEGATVFSLYRLYANITTCRALIATGKYDSACIVLKQVLKIATEFNRALDIIEIQILLSISFWKKKRSFQAEALDCLEDAVWRAYACEHVQIFVNEKKNLSGILLKLVNRVKQQEKSENRPLSFVKMLHLKCYQDSSEAPQSEENATVKYTKKQLAIMQLICEGKTYNEMASALDIKRSTLRTHLELIYRKLDVTNIVDAASKINQTESI